MKIFKIIFLVNCCLIACSQDRGPGYRFDLFKNTQNWELSQAVDREDESMIDNILKSGNINIDLQESKYGTTLLLLAVGNDKPVSTKKLLEHGAKLNILDSLKISPIQEAVTHIGLKKHTAEILKLLLKYGADPNELLVRYDRVGDSIPYVSTPLLGAVGNLECSKLLLEHGANLYWKYDNEYPVWFVLLSSDLKPDQNIFVAKYLIVDKKMPVPDTVCYTIPDHKPIQIISLLNEHDVHGDPEKQKTKEAILSYLKKIDFPNHGAYR